MQETNNMRGITKRGNSYKFTVSLGFDGNNKHIRKYTTFKPPLASTEKQADKLAQKAYFEFEAKCKNKNFNENMRFNELVEVYFEVFAENELKDNTIGGYSSALKNHILPVFGNRKLKDINVSDITIFLTQSDFNAATSKKLKIVLSSIFTFALRQRYITENPCKHAIHAKIKTTEEKINYYNLNQAKELMALVHKYSTFNAIIKLLLYSGLRVGECLALSWKDIDFKNKTISVRHTLTYAKKHWFLSEPKTQNSRRTIKMSVVVSELLQEHKERQDKLKAAFGDSWIHPETVFTTRTGKYYDRSYLNYQFKKLLSDHGMSKLTVHGLRHTNASMMVHNGVSIKAVSKHLGHANISITADIYSHIFEEYEVRIASAIESYLS